MNYQQKLFLLIENTLHPEKNIYREVATALSIEYDAARRRVITDTAITFDEACTLKNYFNIALDSASEHEEDNVNFKFKKFNDVELNKRFEFVIKQLSFFLNHNNNKITITAKDIPFYCYYLVPELVVFRVYYYVRIMWPNSKFKNVQFDHQRIYDFFNKTIPDFSVKIKKIKDDYLQVDTTEIWNKNSLNSHMENILYSWEAGYFENKENALMLLDKTVEVLDHLKKQAIQGSKIHLNNNPQTLKAGKIHMYASEGMQLENTILIDANGSSQMYLILNNGDYLFTHNPYFCQRGKEYIENLITHSSPISKVSEKQRNKLFLTLKQKVGIVRNKIENSTLF